MNGVEILNTIYEYESVISPVWAAILCVLGLVIGVIGVITIDSDTAQRVLFTLEGFVIIGIIVCIIGVFVQTDKVIDIEYKVTIDDSVSMNDFLDKYEILDQEGKIYTVKERE